jgi:hypothetical protein
VHQVDYVAGEQVFRKQDFTGTALETAQVNSVSFEAHPSRGETTNFSDWDEEVATFNAHNGTNYRRVGVIADPGHEVANSADAVTVYVVERAP